MAYASIVCVQELPSIRTVEAPNGFRRSRNYGLTHHRRKILLKRVQLMLHVVIPPARRPVLCWRCGQPMRIRVVPRTFQITDQADSPAQATRSAKV